MKSFICIIIITGMVVLGILSGCNSGEKIVIYFQEFS